MIEIASHAFALDTQDGYNNPFYISPYSHEGSVFQCHISSVAHTIDRDQSGDLGEVRD